MVKVRKSEERKPGVWMAKEEAIISTLRDKFSEGFVFTTEEGRDHVQRVNREVSASEFYLTLCAGQRHGIVERVSKGKYRFPRKFERLVIPTEPDLGKEDQAVWDELQRDPAFVALRDKFYKAFSHGEDLLEEALSMLPPSETTLLRSHGPVERDQESFKMTLSLAKFFNDLPPLPGDRAFSLNRARSLAERVELIDLVFNWYALRVEDPKTGEKRVYRANGGTSSMLLMLAPHLIRPWTTATIVTYDCGSSMRLAQAIYRCFDSYISVRKMSDRVASALHGNPKLLDVELSRGHLMAILSGIKTYATGHHLGHGNYIAAEDMVDMIGESTQGFLLMMSFLRRVGDNAKFAENFMKRDIMAGAYWSYLWFPLETLIFLLEVRDSMTLEGVGLARQDVAYTYSHLIDHFVPVHSGRNPTKGSFVYSSAQMMGLYRNYWKAWSLGTSQKRYSTTFPVRDGVRTKLRDHEPRRPTLSHLNNPGKALLLAEQMMSAIRDNDFQEANRLLAVSRNEDTRA